MKLVWLFYKKKAQLDGLIIDNDILSNIATKIDTNIRELEGVLNRLVAMSTLKINHLPLLYQKKLLVMLYHIKIESFQ